MRLYLVSNPTLKLLAQRERERERESMRLYLAGISQAQTRQFLTHTHTHTHNEALSSRRTYIEKRGGLANTTINFRGLYILESFYYAAQNPYFEMLYNMGIDLLLDSGAFTFMQKQKGATDWEKYITEYAAFINKYQIEKFFELDIDCIVGLRETERLREILEHLTGRKCIPVWHKSRGLDYFKWMCNNYKYVAVGGYVSREMSISDYERAFPWFINTAHKAGAKIHGLGYTNMEGLKKFHFDSVDSTAWIAGNRYGAVYFFDGTQMRKIDKKPGERVVNMQTAHHNLCEWIKFQKYLDR